jgi:hypothetical protein
VFMRVGVSMSVNLSVRMSKSTVGMIMSMNVRVSMSIHKMQFTRCNLQDVIYKM